MAVDVGAHAIGLVGKMPNGPGPISDSMIRTLSSNVPPGVSAFLLTSETDADGIVAHARRTLTDTLQIVDHIDNTVYSELRAALPGIRIVKVIHVTGPEAITESEEGALYADALLLDSGNPKGAVKTLGGTGNVHDWHISREIVRAVPVPVFLAGGLHAGNVREAIDVVGPYGVDICSGVRTEGKLDQLKLDAFVAAVMGA